MLLQQRAAATENGEANMDILIGWVKSSLWIPNFYCPWMSIKRPCFVGGGKAVSSLYISGSLLPEQKVSTVRKTGEFNSNVPLFPKSSIFMRLSPHQALWKEEQQWTERCLTSAKLQCTQTLQIFIRWVTVRHHNQRKRVCIEKKVSHKDFVKSIESITDWQDCYVGSVLQF